MCIYQASFNSNKVTKRGSFVKNKQKLVLLVGISLFCVSPIAKAVTEGASTATSAQSSIFPSRKEVLWTLGIPTILLMGVGCWNNYQEHKKVALKRAKRNFAQH